MIQITSDDTNSLQEPLVSKQNSDFLKYNIENNKEYDPYISPPNLQLSQDHENAMKVGKPKEDSQICICCNNPIQKEQFPLNCSEDNFTFLGCAYPLYFRLSKYVGLILIMVFLVTNSFSIIRIYQNCGDKCIKFFGIAVIDLDYVNSHRTQQAFSVIVVATIITATIFYIKPYIFKDIENYSQLIFSSRPYTIMIQNLPQNTEKDEIKAFFKAITKDKIQKVCMAYDVVQYLKAQKQRPDLIREINSLKHQLKLIVLNLKLREQIITKIKKKQDKLKQINQILDYFDSEQHTIKNEKFIGTAFISFNTLHLPKIILREYGQTFFRQLLYFLLCGTTKSPYLKYKKNNITNNLLIKQPADPQDVIWQNLKFSFATALYNNTFMIAALFMVLYGSFAVQYILMIYVYPLKQETTQINDLASKIKAIMLSMMVVFTNWILKQLTRKFCELQRFDSKSRFNQSYINMYLLLCFVNSAFMPFLIHAKFEKIDIHTDLLIQDILFLLLGNAFTTPITRIFDYNILFKWYQRRKILSYNKNVCPFTQKEANKIFQGRKFDISESYMYIFRTLFVTVWYSSLAPIGLIFSILGITMNYWVDKINLVRFYKIPHCYNEEIIKKIINVLELLPLIFVCGAIQYELRINFSNNILEYVYQSIGHSVTNMALFFCILLYIVLYRQKLPKKKQPDLTYEKQQLEFIMDYDLANPVTSKKARKDRNSFLKKNQKQPQYIKTFLNSHRKNTLFINQNDSKTSLKQLRESVKQYENNDIEMIMLKNN